MAVLTYGFSTPAELFEKLKRDEARLTNEPNSDDVFNFLVTAASLSEWVRNSFKGVRIVDDISVAVAARNWQVFPEVAPAWISDLSCVPNRHMDERHHIVNVLRICWETAGASKHFHWEHRTVKGIAREPIVSSWYQYFFTSVQPDLYIDYDGEAYGLAQIRGILLQYYERLFALLRDPLDA